MLRRHDRIVLGTHAVCDPEDMPQHLHGVVTVVTMWHASRAAGFATAPARCGNHVRVQAALRVAGCGT